MPFIDSREYLSDNHYNLMKKKNPDSHSCNYEQKSGYHTKYSHSWNFLDK